MTASGGSPGSEIRIEIDGATTIAAEGQTIAALLISLGIPAWRLTRGGEARGVFCGIGVCHDCVVAVDGMTSAKACLTPVREGMRVFTQRRAS